MNVVQPIKDKAKLEAVKAWFAARPPRDNLMFLVGINTGLRISDIRKLMVRDVDGKHLVMREQKTGKRIFRAINDELSHQFRQYCKGMAPGEYLFQSREGVNQPITTSMAYRIMREAGAAVGLKHIGTHTMRKTFGYWHYQKYKDLALLCKILGHSDVSITARYIGLDQDTMDSSMRNFTI